MKVKKNYNRTPIAVHNKKRMRQIGDFIKEFRRDMYSREEFAEINNIPKSVIERAENGENITVHSVFRICDALQISPEGLFFEVE